MKTSIETYDDCPKKCTGLSYLHDDRELKTCGICGTTWSKIDNRIIQINYNKKTVIHKLIEKLSPNFFTEEELWFWIEIEKQQLTEAYNSGWKYGFLADSETYYEKTFNTTNKND